MPRLYDVVQEPKEDEDQRPSYQELVARKTGSITQPQSVEAYVGNIDVPGFKPNASIESQTARAIKLLWKTTNGKLPTRLLFAFTQANFDDEDLVKLARMSARQLDLPPSFIWKQGVTKMSEFQDPLHRGPLRAETLARLTESFEPVVLTAMLGGNNSQLLQGVDPRQVRAYLRATLPVARDLNLSALEAISMAVTLARRGRRPKQTPVAPKLLGQNLEVLRDWNTSQGRGLPTTAVLSLAAAASEQRHRLTDGFDIISFIADRTQSPQLQEFVARAFAQQQAEATRQQAVAGEGVFANLPTQARGSSYARYLAEPVNMQEFDALAKVATGEIQGDLFEALQEVQDQVVWEKTAWTRSFAGSKVIWVLDQWNKAIFKGEQGIVEVATPISASINAIRAAFGDVSVYGGERGEGEHATSVVVSQGDLVGAWQASYRFNDDRIRQLQEGKHLGTQMVYEMDLPSWMGTPADLFFTWAADPTIIGGKVLTGIRAGNVLPGALARATFPRAVLAKMVRNPEWALKDPALYRGLGGLGEEASHGVIVERVGTFVHSKNVETLFNSMLQSAKTFQDDLAGWGAHFFPQKGTKYVFPETYMMKLREGIMAGMRGGIRKNLSWRRAEDALIEAIPKQLGNRRVGKALEDALDIGREISQQGSVARELGYVTEKMSKVRAFLDDLAAPGTRALAPGDEALVSQLLEGLGTLPITHPVFEDVGTLVRAITRSDEVVARRALDAIESKLTTQGLSRSQALEVFREGLTAGFGIGKPAVGGIVDDALRAVRLTDDSATRELLQVAEDLGNAPLAAAAREELERIAANLNGSGAVPLMLEIPHRKLLGKGVREGLLRAETPSLQNIGRWAFGPAPRSRVAMHEPLGPQIEALARLGDLPEAEVSALRAEAALLSGPGFENQAAKLVDRILTRTVKVSLEKKGYTGAAAEAVENEVKKYLQRASERVNPHFGVIDKGPVTPAAGVNRPILPDTQRLNFYGHADPADLMRLTDRITGVVGDQFRWAKQHNLIPADAAIDRFVLSGQGMNYLRQGLRTWKFLAVPRPAYTWRVIMFDENARFFGTVGSLLERVASQHLQESGEALFRTFSPTPYLPIVGKPVTYTFGKIGKGLGWTSDKTLGKFLDWVYPFDVHQWGDDVFSVARRPGRLPNEALANTAWRESEVTEDVIRRALFNEKELVTGPGIVRPGQRTYYEQWADRLTNQFGQSTPGRVALKGVAEEKSIADTADDLLEWAAKKPNYRLLRDAGWDQSEFRAWADDLALMTHQYTVGEKAIAQRLLDSGDAKALEQVLRALPDEIERPLIHGQMIESYLGTRVNPLQRYMDYWYDVYVRMPENILNRQPYYKTWYASTSRALYSWVEQEGRTVDDELRRLIHAQSRDTALAQVKKIMFDFADTGKWSQNLSLIFPFMQPFVEAFSVWGHIITHRNPALIGETHALWQAGINSGFVRKDDMTDEWVIPSSWWITNTVGTEMLANTLNKRDGVDATVHVLKAFTPLQAMNLFFSSTLEIPRDGWLGSLAGGAQLPAPSMAPWVTFILQKWLKNTNNELLTSYLFKYGYTTPFFPASWEKVMRGVAPQWFTEDINAAVEKQVARQLDVRGVLDEWKREGRSPQEIQADIKTMADNLVLATGWAQLFQFGQTTRGGEERDLILEIRDLREQFGYEEGTKRYLLKHPEDPLIAVGTLDFGTEMIDLETGKPILDPNTNQPVTTSISLPYAPIVQRLLAQPGFEKVVRDYPEMVGALLLQLDPQVAKEYDPGTLSQLIMRGWLEPKSLENFLAQGESEGPEGFWSTVDRLKKQFPYEDYSQSDPRYTDMRNKFQEALLPLLHQFPFYAYRYLEPVPTVDKGDEPSAARFKYQGGRIPPYAVVAKLRSFGALPELQGFPIVDELKQYFTERDKLAQQMSNRGVSSLDTVAAEDLGYVQKMDKLREGLSESTLLLIDTFVPDDLHWDGAVDTKTEKLLERYRAAEPGTPDHNRYEFYTDFRKKLYDYYSATDPDYEGARALMDTTYQENPWAVRLWWNDQPYSDRESFRQNLITRYEGYYSRWDWHLMGLEVSPKAQEYLRTLVATQQYISETGDQLVAQGLSIDTKETYASFNAWIRSRMKASKNFTKVINVMNQWGWQFDAAGLTGRPGHEGDAWRSVVSEARDYQVQVNRLDLHGFKAGTDEEKAAYAQAWFHLQETVRQWREYSPAFDRGWSELDRDYDGDLLELLMPKDYYFPLGG